MKKNISGFSLIELLLVVVIIGIIAAIAVPNLMASRRSANEGSTVSSLRLLHEAQMTYATSYGKGEYAGDVGAGTLTMFSTFTSLSLVDGVIGSGTKAGYNFVAGREASSAGAAAQFFISAIPVSSNSVVGTGNHRFGVSTDGVIRQDVTLGAQYLNTADVITAPAMGN